jgi:hypothetical protein
LSYIQWSFEEGIGTEKSFFLFLFIDYEMARAPISSDMNRHQRESGATAAITLTFDSESARGKEAKIEATLTAETNIQARQCSRSARLFFRRSNPFVSHADVALCKASLLPILYFSFRPIDGAERIKIKTGKVKSRV